MPMPKVNHCQMKRFRQSSVAKRVAVSVIALCALLFQNMLAAPVAAFGFIGEITCAQNGSGPEIPGGEHHRHHGLCCIFACPACVSAVATSSSITVFPVRKTSSVVWHFTQGKTQRPRPKYSSSARGPPRSVKRVLYPFLKPGLEICPDSNLLRLCRYSGAKADNANSFTRPSYATVNLMARCKLMMTSTKVSFRINVDNLLKGVYSPASSSGASQERRTFPRLAEGGILAA